jgi:hypothetical protein
MKLAKRALERESGQYQSRAAAALTAAMGISSLEMFIG